MKLDYTVIVAVDRRYLEQFQTVWPTWVKYRAELLQRPFVVIADNMNGTGGDPNYWDGVLDPMRKTVQANGGEFTILNWSWPGFESDLSQRERMLTAFLKAAPAVSPTPYWLKIDTDSVAHPGEWFQEDWFQGNPALIASPWGYTKPGNAIDLMDRWAEGVQDFVGTEPLNIHPSTPDAGTVRTKGRIASWVCFVRTDFSQRVADMLHNTRAPVPSQDTVHWYCAKRLGEPIRLVKMSRHGWSNHSRLKRLKAAVSEAMQE